MIEQVDRVVIGATDLSAAVAAYQALGFQVEPPGTGGARIPLAGADLVLVDLHAPTAAGQWETSVLHDFLRERAGGLLGYAVTADLAAARTRCPAAIPLDDKALTLNSRGWRGALPVLVPGAARASAKAEHPNGVRRLRALALVVEDLEQGIARYEADLGWPPVRRDEVIPWRALRATFTLAGVEIHLCAPNAPGLVAGMLALYGEGLWQVTLSAPAPAARRLLEEGAASPAPGVAGGHLIALERAVGARLVIQEEAD
jgi:hypothetical protein